MELKILAKNTLMLASPKVLKFFIGIIRTKFIALFLGVTGTGIVSQLQTTINEISTFTLTSLPEGMVKLIAQQNSIKIDIEKTASIIKTYLLMLIPVTTIVTVLGYVFANEMTIYIFGDLKYKLYFQIGFFALPISILSTTSFAILNAHKEIKSIAIAEIAVIILNLILFIPLIYFFRLTGGVVYVTLSFFVTFLCYSYFARKNVFKKFHIGFKILTKAIFSTEYFKVLIGFVGFGLVAGTYYIFSEIAIRAIVVTELGIDKLGVYAPITAWASLFVGFIFPALRTYLFPRLSEAKSDIEINGLLNDVIRLMTFATLPFIIVGISVRDWIIPLFYSHEFIESSTYLPYHFSAILLTVWIYPFEQVFAPTGRLKIYLIFGIIIETLSLGLVYFLVPRFGLYGYLAKFTIVPFIALLVYFTYYTFEIKFKLKKGNISIILYSVLSVTLLLGLKDLEVYLQLMGAVLLLCIVFLLTKQEKDFVLKKIRRK